MTPEFETHAIFSSAESTAAKQQLERFQAFLEQDPLNSSLLVDTFDIAIRAGALEEANHCIRRGIELQGSTPQWRFRRATLDIAQHRYEEAGGLLGALRTELPQQPAIWHNLAYVAFRQERFDVCRSLIMQFWEGSGEEESAVDAATDMAFRLLWLQVTHRLGRVEEALIWLRAHSQDGLHPVVAAHGSLIALDAGELELAQQWSDEALAFNPSLVEALVARASVALGCGEPELARSLLLQVLRDWPEEGRVWSALGFADLLERRFDQALHSFKLAVQFMPEHVGTWHGLAWTYLSSQSYGQARLAFEKALELDRNFGESHGGLAIAQALEGDRMAAMQSIKLATSLDKSSLSAQLAAALLEGYMYDQEKLQRLAQRLLAGRRGPFGRSILEWTQKYGEEKR